MKIFGIPLKREAPERYSTGLAENLAWVRGNTTASGKSIDDGSALRTSAVYSCIKVLTESVASLPLVTYRRLKPKGKERASSHPLYSLLHDQPTATMDSSEWLNYAMLYLNLRGNFFAKKVYGARGEILELIPIHPTNVRIDVVNNNIIYIVKEGSKETKYSRDWIYHVKAMSLDGIIGLSPIDYMRETIGLSLAAEEHGAKFFSNATTPSGILTHPAKLSKDAFDRLKDQWAKNYSGSGNSGATIITEEGMKFEAMSLSNEQSQFIETRKFQRSDIASWFRVPPHMIGDLERATFSNIEQQSLEFVTYTLTPWFVRFERSIKCQLMTAQEKKNYFVEFLVDGLLRGDGFSRAQKLAIERQNGIITANEWREIENRNPIESEDGDTFLTPLNMAKSSNSEDPEPKDESATEDDQNRAMYAKELREALFLAIKPMVSHQNTKVLHRISKAKAGKSFDKTRELGYIRNDFAPIADAMEQFKVDSSALLTQIEGVYVDAIEQNIELNDEKVLTLLRGAAQI